MLPCAKAVILVANKHLSKFFPVNPKKQKEKQNPFKFHNFGKFNIIKKTHN